MKQLRWETGSGNSWPATTHWITPLPSSGRGYVWNDLFMNLAEYYSNNHTDLLKYKLINFALFVTRVITDHLNEHNGVLDEFALKHLEAQMLWSLKQEHPKTADTCRCSIHPHRSHELMLYTVRVEANGVSSELTMECRA